MDHFGIGAAVHGAAQVYFRSARRTGRTTSLVDSLKEGDIVVFAEKREAQRVAYLCAERGIKIETRVIDTKRFHDIFERYSTPSGYERLILDHSWLEKFYLEQIEFAMDTVDRIQREAGGYGAAHRETARTAAEMVKWREFMPVKKGEN